MSAAGANGLLPFRNRLHAETEEGIIDAEYTKEKKYFFV
jgi:hypothetical protein